MNKAELIAWIQGMPDNLEALPLELECKQDVGKWESQLRSGQFGGVYQKSVDNTLTIRLRFKTRFEGEFRRTYQNQDGMFYNVRRIG